MNTVNQPSTRAKVVTRRSYNRPLDEEGKVFESWEQTVERVIGHQRWLWETQLKRKLNKGESAELAAFANLMLQRMALLSGRTLWLGGTDIAKTRQSSMFNPLPEDTKFISSEGVKSFEDFNDGDALTALTHLGNWKPAKVMNAGVREMVSISLQRGNSSREVESCVDHTWIKTNGERVVASELKVGDSLYPAPADTFNDWSFDESPVDEQYWWCYGLTYGDGAMATSGETYTSRVRLCGDKSKFLSRFTNCGFGFGHPPSCKGDPFVYTGSYQKTLPSNEDEPRLIKAFLMGYLEADGAKRTNAGRRTFKSLSTTSEEAMNFVCRWLPTFGVYISQVEKQSRQTNFGVFDGWRISFTTYDQNGGCRWNVKSVETSESQNCWCLVVEDDHSFVLDNGITSGNCSHARVETVFDVVDCLWLLLQGCGVGFTPVRGTLNGFFKPIETIETIRSKRTEKGGDEHNKETWDAVSKVWTISIGDSAESWAKSIGKMLAGKYPASKLVLDFSNIRPAGQRLKGYGWISSGDDAICKAYVAIANLMNRKAGSLLSVIDILDILNHLGTILSSRRSAEIALLDADDPEWRDFATAKKEFWLGNNHRCQSNNSLVFYSKPTRAKLAEIFSLMVSSGGSEPGFINGASALKRAPWFAGVNPCGEILLGNKSFCNLSEVDIAKFTNNASGLREAIRLTARANYRQTCVDLRDGVLQEAWHLNNEFLRLCGVGLTGIARRPDMTDYDYQEIQRIATGAAYAMAEELGTANPKNVTTIKPSGSMSKIMDTTEGVHKPLGKYIFNNINFGLHDPIVDKMREAGYKVIQNPSDPEAMLVTLPVVWEGVEFTDVDGVQVNLDSAVSQLETYKKMQDNWTQQNTSVTISYDPSEIDSIIDWLMNNWNSYVGVSFIYRTDPTKTAADLGYLYLPQEVVTKAVYDDYVAKLTEVDIDGGNSFDEIKEEECATGACPVR